MIGLVHFATRVRVCNSPFGVPQKEDGAEVPERRLVEGRRGRQEGASPGREGRQGPTEQAFSAERGRRSPESGSSLFPYIPNVVSTRFITQYYVWGGFLLLPRCHVRSRDFEDVLGGGDGKAARCRPLRQHAMDSSKEWTITRALGPSGA